MILPLLLIAAQAAPLATAPAAPPATTCPTGSTPQHSICRALQSQQAGDHQAAATEFEAAAKASPADTPVTARLWAAAGNMWIAAGEPGKAALALDRALQGSGLRAEQRGEALLDRARAAEAQNDLKTARAKVGEAQATISDDPFLWYFSAALAIREEDSATATASINRALSLSPGDPTILFEAGHVAHFAGDIESARDYWSRAWTADTNGEVGKKAEEALKLLPPQPADGAAGPPEKKAN